MSPSTNEATHPRCCDEGYPDGPGRASNKEESWAIIPKPLSESIRQNRVMQSQLPMAAVAARCGTSGSSDGIGFIERQLRIGSEGRPSVGVAIAFGKKIYRVAVRTSSYGPFSAISFANRSTKRTIASAWVHNRKPRFLASRDTG